MTSEKLKEIAARLSNSYYVRYWLHFNYPQEDPALMAIGLLGVSDVRYINQELLDLGFQYRQEEGSIWTIAHTDKAERLERFQKMMDSIPYYASGSFL